MKGVFSMGLLALLMVCFTSARGATDLNSTHQMFSIKTPLDQIERKAKPKPRVIVTSDLNTNSGDPDDKQSMAHLFMYANQVELLSIIPDRWNAHGVEATMNCIDAYEKDYLNLEFSYQKMNYPTPDYLRGIVQKSREDAVASIIREARKDDDRPLHILIWGNMKTFKEALFQAPDIVS